MKTAWETCPSCDGSGHGINVAGEIDNCWECRGYGTVRARDGRGRFLPNPRHNEDETDNLK